MIPLWPHVFVNGVSTITGAWANYVRLALARCEDFVNGSQGSPSTPATTIEISGAGFSCDNIKASTFTGAQQFDAPANFDDSVTANGRVVANGKVILDTDGSGIQYRVDTSNLGDLDASLTTEADIYIAAAAPTVTRTITIAHTSPAAQFGERIRAVNTRTTSGAGWIFQREDSTELGRINTGSNGGWIEFVFDGTKWWATGAGGAGEITPHT